MSGISPLPSQTALELRREFDATFAAAPPAAGAPAVDLLAIRLAGDSYAVELSQVAGLFKDRHVTTLPSPRSDFLGVSGIQGHIVPVYDLRALLGHPPTPNPRWILLVLAPEPLGLAFDAFEGQLRVPRATIAAAPAGRGRNVSQAVRHAGLLRHVVDVASVVEAIRSRVRSGGSAKER